MLADLHQHIWTEPLIDALASRTRPPFVRHQDGLTVLHCAGEPSCVLDTISETPSRCAELVDEDGVDVAVVAISSPIGIEALPRDEAQPLIDAHLKGVLGLPHAFAAWGPFALSEPDPGDIDALLELGCVGISIPAGALAGPERLEAIAELLERIEGRGAPLFVHPGRAPGQRADDVALDEPAWWRPLTDYVWQMQAAWFTFATRGRSYFPDLKVIFTMLAGGGPMQHERLESRGAHVSLDDPNTFYETSSYGPHAVDEIVRLVGEEQLVYGSDRPVIDPRTTGRDRTLQAAGGHLILRVHA